MPRCQGVNYQRAVADFSKIGFKVVRQGGHIIMTNGEKDMVIPRNNPINAFTMGGIIVRAGLTVSEFRELL